MIDLGKYGLGRKSDSVCRILSACRNFNAVYGIEILVFAYSGFWKSNPLCTEIFFEVWVRLKSVSVKFDIMLNTDGFKLNKDSKVCKHFEFVGNEFGLEGILIFGFECAKEFKMIYFSMNLRWRKFGILGFFGRRVWINFDVYVCCKGISILGTLVH